MQNLPMRKSVRNVEFRFPLMIAISSATVGMPSSDEDMVQCQKENHRNRCAYASLYHVAYNYRHL